MSPRKKLTTSEVARKFGVDERTVRLWADDGKLDCTRTLGGARRFDPDYIDSKLGDS